MPTPLVITVAQVLPGADCVIERGGIAGEAIARGQPLYQLASDSRLYKADADASDAAAAAVGIALNDVAAGGPVDYAKGGTIILGAAAAPAKGTIYVVGSVAGNINPSVDLASNWRVTILGVGDASNGIKLQINRSGIALA